nr:hypothetical protein [Chitinophaga eiseniae]
MGCKVQHISDACAAYRLFDVCFQISYLFDAGRKPQQVISDARLLACGS